MHNEKDFELITQDSITYYRYYVAITNSANTFQKGKFHYKNVRQWGQEHNKITKTINEVGGENSLLLGFGILASLTVVEKPVDAKGHISNSYTSIQRAPKKVSITTPDIYQLLIIDSKEKLFNNNQPKDTPANKAKIEKNPKDTTPIYYDDYDNDQIHIHRWWQPIKNNYAEITLEKGHSAFVSAYQKITDGISEWISNLYPAIHRDSYRELLGELNKDSQDNADKIANLFQDYEEKGGRSLSGLIHFHLFRHKENINAAKVIAKELRSIHKDKDNIAIASYLVEKFNELEKNGYKVNREGSFYRRINHALFQLTYGLCGSIPEFKQYQQQFTSSPTLTPTIMGNAIDC